MGIKLGYLVIEGTRKCNMKCAHCLRGNAQRVNMENSVADIVTRQVDSIYNITFTGGEPSLNTEIIRNFQYGFMFNDCTINSFWIATNARFYKENFVDALMDLYSICQGKDECCLTISSDQYHFNQSQRAIDKYSSLCFFSDEKMKMIDDWNLINEGMAKKNQFGTRDITPRKTISDYSIFDDDLYIDDTVYINALGDVLLNSDLSYRTQKKCAIGNVFKESLKDIFCRALDCEGRRRMLYEELF